MRTYDLVLVLRASVSGSAKDKLIDNVNKWLGAAKVVKTNEWGKKHLAYQIKKETEGNYVMLEVESEEGIKGDFEKRLLVEEAILRHLVIRRN